MYEPEEIPQDPNKIQDGDDDVVRLVKELLNTYPFNCLSVCMFTPFFSSTLLFYSTLLSTHLHTLVFPSFPIVFVLV